MKNDPRNISINDYSYDLPEDRIAQFPLQDRDQSKLLIYEKGIIKDHHFYQLPHLIDAEAMVFNNTRVLEARLQFYTSTGAAIEVFLLEPADKKDPLIALSEKKKSTWRCMIGRAAKWKQDFLERNIDGILLRAEKKERENGTYVVELSWDNDASTFADIIHTLGNIPLPPYLNREAEEADKNRYQTVYAVKEGSVAAPTAGLHFTKEVEESLDKKGVHRGFVTLHVGAGTFKPVTADKMEDHEMHSELIDVNLEFLHEFSQRDPKKTVVIGTTSLRTMESLYWLAEMVKKDPDVQLSTIEVDQWIAYNDEIVSTYQNNLIHLYNWANEKGIDRLLFRSRILIVPGYQIMSCGGIITNFHQPSSTLLLLVAAVTKGDWRTIYDHALKSNYRFLSYGDSSYLKVV